MAGVQIAHDPESQELLCILVMATTAAGTEMAAAAPPSGVLKVSDAVRKAAADKRNYRHLTLTNNMQ
eukprot:4863507-Pleurochrysis_carterae.AAC.1